jgi:hypothetical protein
MTKGASGPQQCGGSPCGSQWSPNNHLFSVLSVLLDSSIPAQATSSSVESFNSADLDLDQSWVCACTQTIEPLAEREVKR